MAHRTETDNSVQRSTAQSDAPSPSEFASMVARHDALIRKVETLELTHNNTVRELQELRERLGPRNIYHSHSYDTIEQRLFSIEDTARKFQDRVGIREYGPTVECRLFTLERQYDTLMYSPDAPEHRQFGERFRELEHLNTRLHVLEVGPIDPPPVDPPEYKGPGE